MNDLKKLVSDLNIELTEKNDLIYDLKERASVDSKIIDKL
jgi:hypothetical protein